MDEVKDKSEKDIDLSSWEQEYVEDLPEQKNGCVYFLFFFFSFFLFSFFFFLLPFRITSQRNFLFGNLLQYANKHLNDETCCKIMTKRVYLKRNKRRNIMLCKLMDLLMLLSCFYPFASYHTKFDCGSKKRLEFQKQQGSWMFNE